LLGSYENNGGIQLDIIIAYLFCALEDWHFHILRGGEGGGVEPKLLDLILEYCWSLYPLNPEQDLDSRF
jgi:hypothetical protein